VIGPLGAVLAVPLTLLTKALLLDVDPNTRWMSSLVTGGTAPQEDPAPPRPRSPGPRSPRRAPHWLATGRPFSPPR
jgi:AI-2 transport protein TqsA